MGARRIWLVGLLLVFLATIWLANRDGERSVSDPPPNAEPESGVPPTAADFAPGSATPAEAAADGAPLSPTVTLWGFVREGASGAPLPGARVRVYDYRSRRVFRATTDSAGRFEVVEARGRTSSFFVSAEKDGFARVVVERVGTARTPMLLDLAAAGTIRGRVVAAPDGRPVKAYRIMAVQVLFGAGERFDFHRALLSQAVPDGLMAEASLEVEDPAGRFVISGLRPGKYDLLVFAPGHPPAVESGGGAWYDRNRGIEIAPGREPEAVTVALAALGRIQIRVKDAETGEPVTDVSIFAGAQLDRKCYRRQVEVVSASADGLYEVRGAIDEEGRLESAELTLEKEGFGPVKLSFYGHRGGTLFEALMGRVAGIRGTVSGSDGHPIAGAPVFVERDGDGELLGSLETDGSGSFRTGVLAAGEELTVHVYDPALENVIAVIPLTLEYGEVRNLEVGGEGMAAIHGSVGIGGAAPVRAEVCIDSENRRVMVSTGPDGVFCVEGLAPDDYEVWVSLADGADQPVEVTRKVRLAAGERVRIDLALELLIEGAVWVTDAAGTKPAPAEFEVTARRMEDGEGADVHGTEVVGEAGRFRLLVEKPGVYELSAPGNVVTSGGRIDLSGGRAMSDAELVVRHDPGDGTIVLHPVDADTEEPIDEGEYEFRHDWTTGMGWFDGGRIELEDCGLGLHHIVLQADGYADVPVKVEIATGRKHVEQKVEMGRSNAVRVRFADPDSRAARDGLHVGDLILVYAGVRVLDMGDLVREVSITSPAARVKLTVVRGGERVELEVPGGRLGVYIANGRVEER